MVYNNADVVFVMSNGAEEYVPGNTWTLATLKRRARELHALEVRVNDTRVLTRASSTEMMIVLVTSLTT